MARGEGTTDLEKLRLYLEIKTRSIVEGATVELLPPEQEAKQNERSFRVDVPGGFDVAAAEASNDLAIEFETIFPKSNNLKDAPPGAIHIPTQDVQEAGHLIIGLNINPAIALMQAEFNDVPTWNKVQERLQAVNK